MMSKQPYVKNALVEKAPAPVAEVEVPAMAAPVVSEEPTTVVDEAPVAAYVPPVEPTAPVVEASPVLIAFDDNINAALVEALSILDKGSAREVASHDIKRAQMTLYRTLVLVLTVRDQLEVNAFLDSFSAYVSKHSNNGHFSANYRYQWLTDMSNLSDEQKQEFAMLLGILIDIAPVRSRAQVTANLQWSNITNEFTEKNRGVLSDRLQRYLGQV